MFYVTDSEMVYGADGKLFISRSETTFSENEIFADYIYNRLCELCEELVSQENDSRLRYERCITLKHDDIIEKQNEYKY